MYSNMWHYGQDYSEILAIIFFQEKSMSKKIVLTNSASLIPALIVSLIAAVNSYDRAEALVYNATYKTTAKTHYGNPYADNVTEGTAVTVTMALDNGGNSIANQTWTSSDFKSITFAFGNGISTTFGSSLSNGTSGIFQTNSSGILISVPSNWSDRSGDVISTNSTESPVSWYMNGYNDKYYTSQGAKSVGFPDRVANTVATNWTIASTTPATPVPFEFSPEQGFILGVPLFLGLRKLKKKRAVQ